MPEAKERDFAAGDKILIDGERPGIILCTHSISGERVHGMDYKDIRGWCGWVHPSICRRLTEEEWAARVLMIEK